MISRLVIVAALALSAVAQTATNRCAVDTLNRAESELDAVSAGDYTNSLRLWLPFLAAPTNNAYDPGDCSMYRIGFASNAAASRWVWTNGAAVFDGINDLAQATQRLASTSGTIIARFAAISNMATFYSMPYSVGTPGVATDYVAVFAGNVPGYYTNTYLINVQAGPRRYTIATHSPSYNIVGTNTVAWVHDGSSGTIYVAGIRQPVWNQSGTNSDGWFGAIVRTGAVAQVGSNASGPYYYPGRISWLQIYDRALSSAEIYQVSTRGPAQ